MRSLEQSGSLGELGVSPDGVCMKTGNQRLLDSLSDGAVPPSPSLGHHPAAAGQPYSCVVVPHVLPHTAASASAAAAAAAAAATAFASPCSPPPFPQGVLPPPLGTPPSPYYGGGRSSCSCGASSASSPGACRVHERVFTCPGAPPPVTCGVEERLGSFGSGGGLGGVRGYSDGELAVPCNDDQEVWHPRDDTSEEIKEESVKELLLSLQKQVSIMSLNLSAKIDDIQCHQHTDTSTALNAIRSQLQELTKSVESCQSEVVEVRRDMVTIKHEIDTLQAAKEEIEELRDAVDR
ncbi:unnamed protein product, partial [Meganyctiphanes norvegica]